MKTKWYLIERVSVQVNNEKNMWKDSLSILGAWPAYWMAERYYKKTWRRYRDSNYEAEPMYIRDDRASFLTGLGIVDFEIVKDPFEFDTFGI